MTDKLGRRVWQSTWRQDRLEKRLESLEKLTKALTGELRALQIARDRTARNLVSANDGQASLETRGESAGELQPAAEQAARDLPANDRQASLENRMEPLEKLTEERITAEWIAVEQTAEPFDWEFS